MIYEHEKREKKTVYVGPRPGYPELDADGWDDMENYLRSRQLDSLLARTNGWFPASYQFARRIVIPCSNLAGVPYFQARDIAGKAGLRYASPPASRDDSIVVVWPMVAAKGAVIVEGPMCALAAAELGWLGVSVMGNQPSTAVLTHIAQKVRAFQPVIVIPDADMLALGGIVVSWLSQAGINTSMRVPVKKDLGDMTKRERKLFLA